MTIQHALLVLVCACLYLATLIAAAEPAHFHEARQDPSPQSTRTTSTTTSRTTTMSPTPSSSSATPQPSPTTSSLNFTVKNMTTCTSGLISWNYSGNGTELLLSVTNIGLSRNDALLRNTAIQQQLVDTDVSASSWTWLSVNVPQGWYEIQGLVLSTPIVSSVSAPFFISNGTDVTCLTGTSSSTATPSVNTPSSSATLESKMASIVGGVVGGVVGIALAITVGVYLWSRRRKALFVRRGGRKDRAWGSLKSTSSSIQPGANGAQITNSRLHAHSESTGAILQDVAGGKVSAATTPGESDEDVIALSEEKLVSPASSSGMSHYDALNTPVHYDRRASTYSMQTPTAVTSEAFHSRVPSIRTPAQSLEQQAQRIRSSMETSTRHRSERLSMPTLPSPALSRIPHSPTNTQSKEEYPLTPVNRSISAGAVSMTARRTSRKPVPQYDSSMLHEYKNTDSVSTLTAGAESSQSHGTGMGAGTRGTPSDLAHSTSFGDGRPVHYLIPDMPLPQQD